MGDNVLDLQNLQAAQHFGEQGLSGCGQTWLV